MTDDDTSANPGDGPRDQDPDDTLVDRLFAADLAAIAEGTQDELAPRRALAQLYERYAQLTPDETARMDAEMAVFADAKRSLHAGREAFARGELRDAERLLRVAAAHQMGDAVVYLAALHRRRGHADLADAWRTIAGPRRLRRPRPERDRANHPHQIRDSPFAGPGGFLHLESTWEITDSGLRMTTVIPKG
ncbi:hypothetical protein [Amycolatopsis sp. FDAARGOS 1241]|uniref:hypothetical protein n=1 Tax=Amycolatopsis sp. FDAARGOS 1241 TaxID=2778070 RepID=UPI00194E88B7|nr:hypothetical protein [Amycolatopsis sp. FDAARGOS 1241]QRP47967.1 hypothetical protein I6J71_08790 [Amycolatopsis sp. FDAARGOS 1241]